MVPAAASPLTPEHTLGYLVSAHSTTSKWHRFLRSTTVWSSFILVYPNLLGHRQLIIVVHKATCRPPVGGVVLGKLSRALQHLVSLHGGAVALE